MLLLEEPISADGALLEQLEAENLLLRRQLTEQKERKRDAQERYYRELLEEKTQVIRALHRQVQEAQARPASPVVNPRDEELHALHDALMLEQEQLKTDELTLQQRMRELELQMSRERIDLARQRQDLVSLRAKIQRLFENAQADPKLRERLKPLQREFQELTIRS